MPEAVAIRRLSDGFDMNEDVAHFGQLMPDSILNLVCHRMGSFDSHFGIDFDVHIHLVLVAHLSNQAFFDACDLRLFPGDAADVLGEGGLGCNVHQFVH